MMTALQYFKKQAEELTKAKKKAILDGKNIVTYTDHNGNQHNLYYHSGRWNDRASTVGKYK